MVVEKMKSFGYEVDLPKGLSEEIGSAEPKKKMASKNLGSPKNKSPESTTPLKDILQGKKEAL